jgi:hypothetical protein
MRSTATICFYLLNTTRTVVLQYPTVATGGYTGVAPSFTIQLELVTETNPTSDMLRMLDSLLHRVTLISSEI